MPAFDYRDVPFAVRADIGEAHRAFWKNLARPGSWWDGAGRVAIAAEVRAAIACSFCAARKQALYPYTMRGDHDSATPLDPVAVDAVHRIVTDQDRITATWVDDNTRRGLSKEAYVELAGIVVAVFSIDEFHRALGIPPEPLPDPVSGEPTRYTPANTEEGTGFVPMIARDGPAENEADLWRGGAGANVLRALSLVPDAVRDWLAIGSAQYLSIAEMANLEQPANRTINRMQIELVAGRVSAINQCFY